MNVLRPDGARFARRGRWTSYLLLAVLALAVLASGGWYAIQHVPRLRRLYRRAQADTSRYDLLIREAANRHGVSAAFVKAVIWKESRFLPETVGGKGEAGLMQLTEGAIQEWANAHSRPLPDRVLWFDPRLNVEVGTWYLARAMNRWRGYESMELLALSQYNAGPSRAEKWAPLDPESELPVEGVMIRSTRAYITGILAKTRQYEQTEARE